MKKLLLPFTVLLALFLAACSMATSLPAISFQEVSQKYLDTYGPAEEVYNYVTNDAFYVDWVWWKKGFEVTFANTPYDNVNGWIVQSEYSFPPVL